MFLVEEIDSYKSLATNFGNSHFEINISKDLTKRKEIIRNI